MEIHMREIFSMVKHMEKVFIIGLMVKSTMENGKKVLRMDTVCGEVYSEIAIWDNG
jgi:hypothetical protein